MCKKISITLLVFENRVETNANMKINFHVWTFIEQVHKTSQSLICCQKSQTRLSQSKWSKKSAPLAHFGAARFAKLPLSFLLVHQMSLYFNLWDMTWESTDNALFKDTSEKILKSQSTTSIKGDFWCSYRTVTKKWGVFTGARLLNVAKYFV